MALTVRLLVLDCDGVLTDGTFEFDAKGRPVRRFHFRDMMGLSLAQQAGIRLAILTAEPVSHGLKRRLDVRRYYKTVRHAPVMLQTRDKAGALRQLAATLGIALKQSAMMGDDVNDMAAMSFCGFTA